MLESFEMDVKLESGIEKIFVIPFDIPRAGNAVGYLLILNNMTLGSIEMNPDCKWETEDDLPWKNEELQRMGDQIGDHLLLSIF